MSPTHDGPAPAAASAMAVDVAPERRAPELDT